VTHMLTGACMGRSGFNRKTALATVTMVLAAEAATSTCSGKFAVRSRFAASSRITHSFVGVPFMAAVLASYSFCITIDLASVRPLRVSLHQSCPCAGLSLFLRVLAALSHLLLDYTTATAFAYSSRSTIAGTLDIVYIVDPLIWIVLIAGLPYRLFSLINQEIGGAAKSTGRAAPSLLSSASS